MPYETGSVPQPDELQHQLAIQRVIFTHSRGLDRLDADVLASCYWPESEVDYGAFKGNAHTFCALVIEALPASYELTQHALGNTLVEIEGASAKSESYVTAWHLLIGAQEEMVFSGRYLDALECRDGVWKILHRTVVMDWSRNQAVNDQRHSEAFGTMQKGKHAQNDPLTAFLKQ